MTWDTQAAADGIGIWLTNVSPTQVMVLAPPGVAVPEPGLGVARRREPGGWRLAIWQRWGGSLPVIDCDTPTSLREVSTSYVVSLVGSDLAETVLEIMLGELATARHFGTPAPGWPPREEVARYGAIAAAWLEQEMCEAFPSKAVGLRATDLGAPFPLRPSNVVPIELQTATTKECACCGTVFPAEPWTTPRQMWQQDIGPTSSDAGCVQSGSISTCKGAPIEPGEAFASTLCPTTASPDHRHEFD